MGRKPIYPKSIEALEKMHTGSLLSRLKQLQMCEASLAASDKEFATEGLIEFKDTEAWANAYGEVKKVLSYREHIPRSRKKSGD
ncbi:hypothetical protein [Leptothoe kymatousa]|uniref:Uncharacterized protein n=1 Tax=Leptothoe kymatousa TAU-MAC 1615 TaxID=2364775 RepID=A0ABS5Y4N0_9CYAN|nr:hypothetical protein [Leptothoe kymatousa]MBT9312785.1 hypothetical protein [Leptothoe kymatousa TAU-MAC 1615]